MKEKLIAEYGQPVLYRRRTERTSGQPDRVCHVLVYEQLILFAFEDTGEVLVRSGWETSSPWFYPPELVDGETMPVKLTPSSTIENIQWQSG